MRGFSKSEHLRARSTIEPHDRNPYDPCWHWQGAKVKGVPRIWAFDYDTGEKRCMCGPKAVWGIAKGQGTGGKFAFRKCLSTDCVNPGHHALAATRKDIGAHIAASGRRKGTALAARRSNIEKAWAKNGVTPTPPDVVRAIRAADPKVTNVALAKTYGIWHTTVSLIRKGMARASVA